uniref:Dimer_Tnp_hAT domain-containing protein n=1 Tax=Panagrellus redivivus TaxID=6233 RepID=A0A7E4URG6_PANRE
MHPIPWKSFYKLYCQIVKPVLLTVVGLLSSRLRAASQKKFSRNKASGFLLRLSGRHRERVFQIALDCLRSLHREMTTAK